MKKIQAMIADCAEDIEPPTSWWRRMIKPTIYVVVAMLLLLVILAFVFVKLPVIVSNRIARAVVENDLEYIENRLKKEKKGYAKPHGIYILSKAAELERPEVAELVIKYGYNINGTYCSVRSTPLIFAVECHSYQVCEVLLKNNADVNIKDGFGRTAIYYAVDNVLIEHIIAKGAKLDERDSTPSRWTPLHYAVSCFNINLVRALLLHKVDVHEKDADGKDALDIAQ